MLALGDNNDHGKLIGYVRRVGRTDVLLHIDVGDDFGRDVRVVDQAGVNFRLGDRMKVDGNRVWWKGVELEVIDG